MHYKTEKLMAFLDASVSVYHAAAYLAGMLEDAGYTRLSEGENWNLTAGGKYFLTRGGTAVLAFRVPETSPNGFLMTASHSDRPTFKVKENAELKGKYTRISTEKYGGMLIAPWLDRPLSIAGRVLVETEEGIESRLVNIDRDLLMIPNVAIHMNRQANDGYKWNPAVDTMATASMVRELMVLTPQASSMTCWKRKQAARFWGMTFICTSARKQRSGEWMKNSFLPLHWMIWNVHGPAPRAF